MAVLKDFAECETRGLNKCFSRSTRLEDEAGHGSIAPAAGIITAERPRLLVQLFIGGAIYACANRNFMDGGRFSLFFVFRVT